MRRKLSSFQYLVLWIALGWMPLLFARNQTDDVSPIFPGSKLPFRVRVEILKDNEGNDFLLPNGLQAYNVGVHKGKWLLINGRTNGLHGFNDNPDNFPPQAQNTTLYVVDPVKKTVATRSLLSSRSGLTQDQVDSLSVTDAQSYQTGKTLYLTGGYGFRRAINNFTTFGILTAIDVPGLIRWVTHSANHQTARRYIRQTSHFLLKVTGGEMFQLGKNKPTLLIFGQDFEGPYSTPQAIQVYSEQVRRFHIHDNGKRLSVEFLSPQPVLRDPDYRRRDLNVVPVISRGSHGKLVSSLVALSGVFTVTGGIWTVPVSITAKGIPSMANPFDPRTFKQGMNNYACPTIGLFSRKTGEMYTILFGGLSYGFFQNGTFQTDSEIPFINQITTIKIDKHGQYTQYIMDEEYPVILSTQSNPGNQLLFGTSAEFIPSADLDELQYDNGVFKLDKLRKPILLGYIVGGIQSTLPNTNSTSDSAASPYIFTVTLEPLEHSNSDSD